MDFDFATLEKRAADFFENHANLAEFKATLEEGRVEGERICELMRPDPEILRQPMTI